MKKNILFVLIIMVIFSCLTVVCATDNNTALSTDNHTSTTTHSPNLISSDIASDNKNISSSKENVTTSNTRNSLKQDNINQTNSEYYINASVLTDGNGSKENPWNSIKTGTFRNLSNGSTVYIADGVYSFNVTGLKYNDITLIGESVNNTILQGTFYVHDSNLKVYNISFNSNNFTNFIYSVFLLDHGNITIDSSVFMDNRKSVDTGSVIYCYGDYEDNIIINNSIFTNNNDGVLDLKHSNAIINSSVFTNNKEFSSNSGCVINAYDTNILINNSQFINNSALMGGVIVTCNGSGNSSFENQKIIIINSSFDGNNATYEGGVVYDVYSSLYIESSNFTNNYARSGGVIYSDDLKLSIESSNFNNNSVKNLGGVIYANQNRLSLTSNNFTNNKAYAGDDLYTQYTTSAYLNENNWSNNNSITLNSTNHYVEPKIIITELNDTNTSVLPSRYDLRDYGYVTSVKNQRNDGNCWAFATIATLESCILKAINQTYDLSEDNMKNIEAMFSQYGYKVLPNQGGSDVLGIDYLVNWFGPVLDSDDKYILNSRTSPLLDSILHVTNIYCIPLRNNYTDNNLVKEVIMKYGGIFTNIQISNQSCNSSYSINSTTNHGVCIVGWDDNYSKDNFQTTPPGDGAFIVKNSWGVEAGDKGYYYVSYYDKSILTDCCVSGGGFTFILNDTESYDNMYQYHGGFSEWYNTTNNSTYSNEYTITKNETLRAFGTYVKDNTNLTYTARIYRNNMLKYTQTGEFTHTGYETIKLNKSIPVNTGDNVKIELQLTSIEGIVNIPVSNKDYSRLYATNKSLINGISYNDAIAILKLYTIERNNTITNTTINIENSTYPTVIMKGKLTNVTEGVLNITIYDKEDNIVQSKNLTVDSENWNTTFTGLNTGEYKVVVTYPGDNYYEAFTNTTTFTVTKGIAIITSNNVTAKLGKIINLNAKVTSVNGNNISSGKAVVKVNDKTFGRVNITNGVISYDLNITPEDFGKYDYKITFVYGGNENYNATRQNVVLAVSGYEAILEVNATNNTCIGDTITITVNITNGMGYSARSGNVGLKINGVTYKINGKAVIEKIVEGIATFKINSTSKMVGNNNITITYSGNSQFYGDRITIPNLFTVENKTRIICTIDPLKGKLGQNVTLTAKFTTTNKKSITNKIVVVKNNEVTLGYAVIKDGIAKYKLYLDPQKYGGQNYNITFKYAGSTTLTEAIGNNILTVTKYAPKFTYTPVNATVGSMAKLTVQISNKKNTYNANSGTVGLKINGITYKIDGKAYIVKIINKTATFNIPITKNMRQNNTIIFTYSGNSKFNSGTKIITNGLTVKT